MTLGLDEIPQPIGFFESILGLICSPIETTERLFADGFPRHFLACTILAVISAGFIATQTIPAAIQSTPIWQPLLSILGLGLGLYVFLATIMFLVLGAAFSIRGLMAIFLYAAVPPFMLFWLTEGLIKLKVSFPASSDAANFLLNLGPFIETVAVMLALIVFFWAVKAMTRFSFLTAALSAMLALAVFVCSFAAASLIMNTLKPGSTAMFNTLLPNEHSFPTR